MPEQFVLIPERRAAFRAGFGDGTDAPLALITGPSGSGKSAVCSAIVSTVAEAGGSVVRYTGATWIAALHAAEQSREKTAFFESLARLDLLVLADLSPFDGQPNATRHLASVLDSRESAGLQTVMVSERGPRVMGRFLPLLVDRLIGGVRCDLADISDASAIRLLQLFAERHRVSLTTEAAERLLAASDRLPASLARSVASVAAAARREGSVVSLKIAAAALRRRSEHDGRPTLATVEKAVAREFEVSVAAIRSTARDAAIALPRQVAMFLARQEAAATYDAIGRYFSRNHSTVMHACRRVAKRLQSDTELTVRIERVTQSLHAAGR